eukprot:6085403-Lingulodinium_polyedra.AAC.1
MENVWAWANGPTLLSSASGAAGAKAMSSSRSSGSLSITERAISAQVSRQPAGGGGPRPWSTP